MKRNFCIQCGKKIDTSFQTKFCSKRCWERYKVEHSLQVSPERQATVFLKSPFTSQDVYEESSSDIAEKALWKSLAESKSKPQSLETQEIRQSVAENPALGKKSGKSVSQEAPLKRTKAVYKHYVKKIKELQSELADRERKIELLNRTISQDRIEIKELKEKLARTIEVCSIDDEDTLASEPDPEVLEQIRATETPWWKRIFRTRK